jgi:hypothetical protein
MEHTWGAAVGVIALRRKQSSQPALPPLLLHTKAEARATVGGRLESAAFVEKQKSR